MLTERADQFIRLGKKGYRAIMMNLTRTADYLAACLAQLGFIIMSEGGGRGLPLVAFRLDPAQELHFDEFAVAHQLRERGWVVPAYTMAPHAGALKLLRVVCRSDFSRSRCDGLVSDVRLAVETLTKMSRASVAEYQLHCTENTAMVKNRAHRRHARKHQEKYKDETHSLQGKTGKTHAIC